MSNYATKEDLENAIGVDISKFSKKFDLASLKFEVDSLDIDKFERVPTGLISLKGKVDKLDVDKLIPIPVDLSELSELSDVVKKILLKRLNMMN